MTSDQPLPPITPPPLLRKPYPLFRRLTYVGLTLFVWFAAAVWLVRGALIHEPDLPVWWTAAESEPPPDLFRFIVFPPNGGIDLLDQPGGKPIGTVTRALYSDPSELGKEFVPVRDAGQSGVVRYADLRWHAPPEEAEPMLQALGREFASRPPPPESYHVHANLPDGGRGEVVFEVWNDGIERSTYEIGDGPPRPLKFQAAGEAAIGITGAAGVLGALLIAAILFIPAGCLCIYLLIRR